VEILRDEDNVESRLFGAKADLFMTDLCVIDLNKQGELLKRVRAAGTKVGMWVHWPPATSATRNTDYLINNDVADLYYGERELDHAAFHRDTGKSYVCIPHAANPKYHFPAEPSDKYATDILYIGSRLPHKRWFEVNVLNHLIQEGKYKVTIIGVGWSVYDQTLRAARRLTRIFDWSALKDAIEKRMVKIPLDEERFYYSSAKICLNFHEREPDGSQPHYIVNQRAFKIPACGGFQICDEVPALRNYFDEDEIVLLPLDQRKWLDSIRYYLENDGEREAIRKKGAARAKKDHLSVNRCELLFRLLGGGGTKGLTKDGR
jgi:spore maturation protein CgeB